MAPNESKNTSDGETGKEEINFDDATPTTLVFFVNGRKVEDSNVDPEMTLLTYLRTVLGLCGTKLGCGEGGCGACTVMVSQLNKDNTIGHLSINACLAPVCSLHGMAVTTVEGIGSTKTKLHAVQERIANAHGSQCGFCTPGIVMSMYTLLRNNPKPKMEDIEVYFQGNLCRCTGYRPILEGFKSFTQDDAWSQSNPTLPPGCCGGAKNGVCCMKQDSSEQQPEGDKLFRSESFSKYDPSQEIIFPPELKLSYAKLSSQPLVFRSDRMVWFRPTSLKDFLSLKQKHPDAKIVVGNTELGVEMKVKKCHYPVMIQPVKVPDVVEISTCSTFIKVGSAVTLTDLERFLSSTIKSEPRDRTRVFVAIIEMLHWFAGKQIRNAAAIGGNIMTGSPISDLNPIFMAAGCELEVGELDEKGAVKTVLIPFDHTFFTGYRRNVVQPHQVLVSLRIPYTRTDEYFSAYKQSRRREDDIAIVNGAFFFRISSESKTISNVRMAFGGMAPFTKMALDTANFLIGKPWSTDTLDRATAVILEEFKLPPGVPGGMARYRQALTASLLLKSFLKTSLESNLLEVPSSEKSAGEQVNHQSLVKSHQLWSILPEGAEEASFDPLGKPIKHKSADLQATGEAVYVDDIPRRDDEVYASFVVSSKAHARLIAVDPSEALQIPGVVDFASINDIEKQNNQFHVALAHDEQVFADGVVRAVGQIIGVVVADNQAVAQRAAAKVKITYEELPAIVTMDEAIKNNSFYDIAPANKIVKGDAQGVIHEMRGINGMIEGHVRIGGQEHFYLETHASLIIPNENGELEVFAGTQNPTETQFLLSHALGIPMNKINVKVKRIGGGFGGKESRSIPLCLAAAVAACKVNRPVRFMLDRDEDMLMTGHRNPFLGKYKAGFTKDGIIKALDVDLYSNAGFTLDLTFSVVQRAMFHVDNCYYIENINTRGHCCKTNIQSNTAFRGFGGPQGMFVTEHCIEEIADSLNMDPTVIREKNLYQEGQSTHFNTVLDNFTVRRCWEEVKKQSNFYQEQKNVEDFNAKNRWKKRGISVVPTKFGISFTALFLNQAGALVQVYRDGSVLINHGGVEMGQGLHTKMIQIASKTLQIPHEKINFLETATDKVPNTSPSAASATSDLNGMALYNACSKINERLEPLKKKHPNLTWEELIRMAYFERVSLSASGFYATPDIGYNFETNSGIPFCYFTNGASCSVVEIDCLTGDHKVLRTDIVMDVGESINPAIDIGQIEGGFMQGYGLFIMEQLVHSPEGVLFTRGPGAYKIPSFSDIPNEFNVSLLRGSSNPKAVFSSKGIGEPPLFLASSIFFAIRQAIKAARKEVGLEKVHFQLDSPLTAERIRMACEDHLTKKVTELPQEGTFKHWGIQV